MLRSHPYGANYLALPDTPELAEAFANRVLFRYSAPAPGVADRLEAEVVRRLRVGGALACPNGTQALRLALMATRPRSGERVYVPAVTFVAVAGAVLSCGLLPVCVDVTEALHLDASLLPAGAQRVVVAHMDGMVGPVPDGVPYVIEDSAQAMGGVHPDGRPVGSAGFAGTFSFHHAKVLTSGEGGLVVTRDAADRAVARAYSDHGSAREQGCYPQFPAGAFFGENLCANEAVAAVQLQQFRVLDRILERLERHHAVAVAALSSAPVTVVPRTAGDPKVSVHVELPDRALRDRALDLLGDAGLPGWTLDKYLLPDHPVVAGRQSLFADGYPWSRDPDLTHLSRDGFAGTRERLGRRLALPLAPELDDAGQDAMAHDYATVLEKL